MIQCRQQHGRQNGNNGNDDQQLDKSEAAHLGPAELPVFTKKHHGINQRVPCIRLILFLTIVKLSPCSRPDLPARKRSALATPYFAASIPIPIAAVFDSTLP